MITKNGGSRVRFTSSASVKSPGFDINDIGFLQRADQRTLSNWIQMRYDTPSKYLRSFRHNLNQWAGWNFDRDLRFSGGNVNAHAVFANNWSTGFGINVSGRGFDDRATRGGPGVYTNSERALWTYLSSDNRHAVSAGINTYHASDGRGTTFGDLSPSLSYRPSSFLTVSGGLRFSRNRDETQWIERAAPDRYIFGRLRQTTAGVTARMNYTVTPALSIQIYAEPFVSAGEYSNFKQLVTGRLKSYEGRYTPAVHGSNPDFNYRSFRTTNVLRWEYKPGSTLFAVWQQGREDVLDRGTFSFNRDFGGVFDAPARNVFLIKWAYWVNLCIADLRLLIADSAWPAAASATSQPSVTKSAISNRKAAIEIILPRVALHRAGARSAALPARSPRGSGWRARSAQ